MTEKRLKKIIQKVALNTLYVKEKEIYPASIYEKQIILLMIPNKE